MKNWGKSDGAEGTAYGKAGRVEVRYNEGKSTVLGPQ